MKKIIIPFGGADFSNGAFSFARMLNEESPILLTAVFLPKVDYTSIFLFPSAFAAPAYIPVHQDYDEEAIKKSINEFIALCQKYNIEYKIHKSLTDSAISQLSKETRFADLMIIGSEVFDTAGTGEPIEYLKKALHNTECPVMIVPEKFSYPSQLILAYDGSDASVYAIKQFVYLFPGMCKLNTMLIYAGDEKHDIPERELIEEYSFAHFKNLAIRKIYSDDTKSFDQWVQEHWNPLLVSGSFGRSGVSELFRRSFVMDTIREHTTSVFIAHQ